MDSKGYLTRYGWKEGEALQKGGLKRPILVKQKKDNKGLGHDAGDAVAWWEQIFDGQLKSLDVSSGDNGITFSQSEQKVAEFNRSQSPLYKMFVKGKGLAGTMEDSKKRKSDESVVHLVEKKRRKNISGSSPNEEENQKSRKEEKKRLKRLRKEEKKLKKHRKEEKKLRKAQKEDKRLEKLRKKERGSKKEHKKHSK